MKKLYVAVLLVFFAATGLFAQEISSRLDIEGYSDEGLIELKGELERKIQAHRAESNRLKNRWDKNPTPIVAERIRRDRILEDRDMALNKLIEQAAIVEDEISLRKHEAQEKIDAEKRREELRLKREAELKALEKQNTISDIEDWDPETKAKIKLLEREEAIRRAKLEEKLAEEQAASKRNTIIIISLILIAAIGAIAFIFKKMKA